eukprot:Hpha_TRINITY_DN15868_c2_g9::TRINITY_DN15868_c2_g9_i1::g.192129::m.192129
MKLSQELQERAADEVLDWIASEKGSDLGLKKGDDAGAIKTRFRAEAKGNTVELKVSGEVSSGARFHGVFELEGREDSTTLQLQCKEFEMEAKRIVIQGALGSVKAEVLAADEAGWASVLKAAMERTCGSAEVVGWKHQETGVFLAQLNFQSIKHGGTYAAQEKPLFDPSATLSIASESVRSRADIVDTARVKLEAEIYSSSAGELDELKAEMKRFAERLMAWYDAKPGNLIDEMVENLRTPSGEDILCRLGLIAKVLGSEPRIARSLGDLSPAELLVVRGYTQKPIDIDRDVGWKDAPPPPMKNETKAARGAREAYESRHTDWNWSKSSAEARNGSLYGTVCSATRDQGPGGYQQEWSEHHLQKWIKWTCTLAAICAGEQSPQTESLWRGLGGGGLPGFVVEKHRGLRPGGGLAWPAPSSTSHDSKSSMEYMLGTAVNSVDRPNPDKPGTIMFELGEVCTGRELQDISQYPAEAELLLGPLTLFKVDSVEDDPRNELGQGLQIKCSCLGPMGGLDGNPWLRDFYSRVRADARSASESLRIAADESLLTLSIGRDAKFPPAPSSPNEVPTSPEATMDSTALGNPEMQRLFEQLAEAEASRKAMRVEEDRRARAALEEASERLLDRSKLKSLEHQIITRDAEMIALSAKMHDAEDRAQQWRTRHLALAAEVEEVREREAVLREELAAAAFEAARAADTVSETERARDALLQEHSAAIRERDASRAAMAEAQKELEATEKALAAMQSEARAEHQAADWGRKVQVELESLTLEHQTLLAEAQTLRAQSAEEASLRRKAVAEQRRVEQALRRVESELAGLRDANSTAGVVQSQALQAALDRQQVAEDSYAAAEARGDELRIALRRMERELEGAVEEVERLKQDSADQRELAIARERQLQSEFEAEQGILEGRFQQISRTCDDRLASAARNEEQLRSETDALRSRVEERERVARRAQLEAERNEGEAERLRNKVKQLEERCAAMVVRRQG